MGAAEWLGGKPVQMLLVVYTGAPEGAAGIIDGLSRLGRPLAAFVGPSPWVAIIGVYPFGFEGPDRRFLAVPLDR